MVYIAEHGADGPVLAREIAPETRVPKQYLSTILREAVRAGLLKSTRGKGGGFRLAKTASRIRLVDVFRPFDDVVARSSCPLGYHRCDDDDPCMFHQHWKPVAVAYKRMLEEATLQDVLTEGSRKQKQKRPRRKKK